MKGSPVMSLDWENPLEKGMATHSRILAWRIPWTEEPGKLQSMGSQRTEHNWVTFTLCVISMPKGLTWWLRGKRILLQCRRPCFNLRVGESPWRRKRLPTPVFLPGESHGHGSLEGYSPWIRKQSDRAEPLNNHPQSSMPKHRQECVLETFTVSRLTWANKFANSHPLEIQSIQVRKTHLIDG